MFTKISDIKKQFFGLFYKAPIFIYPNEIETAVTVRYAQLSSGNYTEEQLQQQYPVISIYDYTPTLSDKWANTGQVFYGNERDLNNDGIVDTVAIYKEPILLNFRFDVSFATKSYAEQAELEDYFMQRFLWNDVFLLDEVTIGGEKIGASCFLYCTPQKIPRPDGVFEVNYEFNFDTFLQVGQPEDVQALEQLNITVNPVIILP